MKKFVDVILPLPLHSSFTYSLPDEWADRLMQEDETIVEINSTKYLKKQLFL